VSREEERQRKTQQVATTTETQLSELATKFERDFSLVSCLSTNTIARSAWYLDSGASRHMTEARELFNRLSEEDSEIHVELGDDAKYAVRGQGTVQFQLESGGSFDAQEVLYVPGLKKNLLSISVMEDKGYAVTFHRGQVFIYPEGASPDTAMRIGVREGNLYRLQGKPVQALVHNTESLCELWHRRMGHLHHRALPILREMVTGLPDFSLEQQGVCRGCALGKNVKASFPSSETRSKGILDLIHSDVCGPMSVSSVKGASYYVTFIDDFSRKTWIYFMRTKDEVFSKFKEFKAQVENLTGKKIKVLRTDNGGEYTSNEFRDFCKEAGIKREKTMAYNPQQNGVAERKNRSIVSAVKAMIHDQSLPMVLWAEACNTTVYLQNRSPHRILEDKTPEEAFTGVRPEIGHLRIFGCPVYIHIPVEKRTKLEPSGQKGILVGYNEDSKAYRVFLPDQRKTVVSRDVKFEENLASRKSHEIPTVAEDTQQVDPKDEQSGETSSAGGQPSGEEEQLAPSKSARRPRWFEQTLRDAQEHVEAPKTTFRESRPPRKFSTYMALMTNIIDSEPSNFEEATNQQVWRDAMVEEHNSIMKNDVWEIVPRPVGKSVVTSRWLYKIKHATDGSVEKYKARFVARGFSQKEGVDYEETFAPVARYSSIRAVISIASEMGWRIHQMDVKTTFLNEIIEEEVYIEQPQGFEVHDRESYVCRLKKALYGLKQASRAWYSRIDNYLQSMGFTKSEADPNLYFLLVGSEPLILVLYVDDLILTGAEKLIAGCKSDLASEFEMKDIGLMHYFLGLEVWQRSGEIFLGQGKYTLEILKRFRMEDSRPMATPMVTNLKKVDSSDSELADSRQYRQLIGSLMYLVNTRPDICFVVNTLSQYMVEPRQVHWIAAKHVLRYLQGTVGYGLRYLGGDGVKLQGYSDSDWAGSDTDRKSTSGCCFSLGSAVISWFSRKQPQ
jgi:transposase InsO family protein